MDFRHQIVTCLFSMLRLSFETQKIKENYAIFSKNVLIFDVEFYSGHIRFHIRPHEFVRTYNYMGRTCKKHVF